jgi:hypothetical protein
VVEAATRAVALTKLERFGSLTAHDTKRYRWRIHRSGETP